MTTPPEVPAHRVALHVDLLSDRELVRHARAGLTDAQAELFRRHRTAVWRRGYAVTGRREAADDVTQETFERAFRYLSSFAEGAALKPWLQQIATNQARDLVGRERALEPPDQRDDQWTFDPYPSEDAQLRRAVARLAPERRAVVLLRFWADMGSAEISLRLGIPVGTVHSRLSRALDDLRSSLDRDDPRPDPPRHRRTAG